MHHKFRILITSLIVVCVWATATYAQKSETFPVQPEYYGSISYISVGLDERKALNQMVKEATPIRRDKSMTTLLFLHRHCFEAISRNYNKGRP